MVNERGGAIRWGKGGVISMVSERVGQSGSGG